MRNLIWKLLAKLAAWPPVTNWIIRNAQNKPYYHLNGYMDRWWLTPRILLTRDEFGNLFPYSWVPMFLKVRVHHTKRADREDHKHDHPADNCSVVMRGWVDEMDVFNRSNLRTPGQIIFRRAHEFHKLVGTNVDGVWTLWFMGKKINRWGFLVDGRKVYWRDYFEMKEREEIPA